LKATPRQARLRLKASDFALKLRLDKTPRQARLRHFQSENLLCHKSAFFTQSRNQNSGLTYQRLRFALNFEPLNPEPLNPEPLNPEPLNP
jgi:hypothetical protein